MSTGCTARSSARCPSATAPSSSAAAYWDEWAGRLKVPALGRSPKTGQACPSTRSFDLVDQDPSDNVTSTYLLTGNGQTAQDNAANEAALGGAKRINNGSDNLLLDAFVDPTLGCTPFEAPDLSTGGDARHVAGPGRAVRGQEPGGSRRPGAGERRDGAGQQQVQRGQDRPLPGRVGQPPVSSANNEADSPASFCQNMVNMQTPFLARTRVAGHRHRHRSRPWATICSPSWPTGWPCRSPTSTARTTA